MIQETAPHPRGNQRGVISILIVVTAERAEEIERIVAHTSWRPHVVQSVKEAAQALRSVPLSVALCEDRLTDGAWFDLLSETRRFCPRPETIVMSGNAGLAFWKEVCNAGGYDLLALPIDPRELYEVVPAAWRRFHGLAGKNPIDGFEAQGVRELVDVT